MRFAAIFLASALAAFASAQNTTTTTITTSVSAATTSSAEPLTQTQQMPASATAGFDPNNVTESTKDNWCQAQRNSCIQICGGVGVSQNECLTDTLTYTCECYNGTVPDCTRWKETLPFNICIDTRRQCINRHENDQQGQQTCEDTAKCASMEPPTIAAATPVTSASSSTASHSGSATSTSATAAATTSHPNAGIAFNAEVSTGAFAALLMAALQLL